MIKKQSLILLLLCISSLSCFSQTNDDCEEINLQECVYMGEMVQGEIILFTPLDCNKAEALNRLIILNSEWLRGFAFLPLDSLDYFFNEHKVPDIFALGLVRYQKIIDEMASYYNNPNYVSFGSGISTDVIFIGNNIITYTVVIESPGDKGSPYYDEITIDLKNKKIFDFADQVKTDKTDSIKEFLTTYALNHKKEIINNHLHSFSGRADHLLGSYLDVFEQDYYSLTRVKLGEIGVRNFSHLTPKGAVFFLSVIDENFLLDEERKYEVDYGSNIIIPYKELENYLDKKSDLYLYIQELDVKNKKLQ